jgi:hypothetical protein
MLREVTNPPAAVNVLNVSSESMAAFQVFMYGRFWVFTEDAGDEESRQHEEQIDTRPSVTARPHQNTFGPI